MRGEEGLENVFALLGGNPFAVVNDMQFDLRVGLAIARDDTDAAGNALLMTQRIAEKISQHLMKV